MIVETKLTKKENTCVAIGHFDGLHLGCKKVIDEVIHQATQNNLTSVVVSLTSMDNFFTSEQEKSYLLKDTDLDYFISCSGYNIDELVDTLGIKVLVTCQDDQHIEEFLKRGVKVVTIPAVTFEGKKISHELLLEAYKQNDYEKWLTLCGHPFIIMGEVTHGKGQGKNFGFPTANLKTPDNKVKPQAGVYGTKVIYSQTSYLAVTNIGTRPTVDDSEEVTIESYILDFDQDIYGEGLIVEVYEYVRGIRKFDDLYAVKAQIDKDVEKVKKDLLKGEEENG